jgi:hypothetical protein
MDVLYALVLPARQRARFSLEQKKKLAEPSLKRSPLLDYDQ